MPRRITSLISKIINIGTNIYGKAMETSFALPFTKIDRHIYITKHLRKIRKESLTNQAMEQSLSATLTDNETQNLAKKEIAKHTAIVFAVSAITAIPTSLWLMTLGLIIDLWVFQANVFIISQKLLFIYADKNECEHYKIKTSSKLMLLMTTVMIGKHQITRMAKSASGIIAKQIVQRYVSKALTKATVQTAAKQICKWLGITLSKALFLKSIEITIIFSCATISGLVSYFLFVPMAKNLQKHLKEDKDIIFAENDL